MYKKYNNNIYKGRPIYNTGRLSYLEIQNMSVWTNKNLPSLN